MASEPMSQEWKVPVEPIPVRLQYEDGRCEEGEVYLQLATPAGRPQTVLDLLNDDAHFLAVSEDSAFRLVHKEMLLWIEAAREHLLPPDEGVPPDEHGIIVELPGDHEPLQGVALVTAPPGHRRILDHLNGPETFFALRGEESVRILNKHHIRSIEPRES